jgi:hypothetical protein
MTCRSNCLDSEPFSTELGPKLYWQVAVAVHFQMGCKETVYRRKSISVPRPGLPAGQGYSRFYGEQKPWQTVRKPITWNKLATVTLKVKHMSTVMPLKDVGIVISSTTASPFSFSFEFSFKYYC